MEIEGLLRITATIIGVVSAAVIGIFVFVYTRKKGIKDGLSKRIQDLDSQQQIIGSVKNKKKEIEKIESIKRACNLWLDLLSRNELICVRVPFTNKKVSVKNVLFVMFILNILMLLVTQAYAVISTTNFIKIYTVIAYGIVLVVILEIITLAYTSYFALIKHYGFEDLLPKKKKK